MFAFSPVARVGIAAALTLSLGASFGCNKSDSPTAPTPPTAGGPPVQTPPPPPPPAAPAVGAVQVTANPNPVPHSGAPITDAAGCVNVAHTWFYDQIFRETGGVAVTFTNRIDLFDNRETNNTGNLNIVVPAGGTNQ